MARIAEKMSFFILDPCLILGIACGRTPLTAGVLLYYNSKDIAVSSVCLIRRRKNPALQKIFIS